MRYLFENYALDTDRRELQRDAQTVALTPQVFDILDYLIRNSDRVVSKDDLIAAIWSGRIVSESALTTRINAVRTAIGDDGRTQRLVKTLPRRGLRFIGLVRQEHSVAAAPANVPRAALSLPAKPSVAVLPFTVVSLGAEATPGYFSIGITEDIVTALSRFSELFVIAHNSSFQYEDTLIDIRQIGQELGVRYLLQGAIRLSDDRIRISVQLIEATSGIHRWAERYDRKLGDIFAIEDEVARAIATTLISHINQTETERTLLKPPASWQAHDYYMRATSALASYWSSVRVDDLREVRRLLERSLAIDPTYARAYAALSKTYVIAWLNRLDEEYLDATTLGQAHRLACAAVKYDPNMPQAHASLGAVLAWQRQYEASIGCFEHAIALNPNFIDWRFAIALVSAGEPQRAIRILKTHMRLDPFYAPLAPHWLGLAYYMLRQYSKALPPLRECVARAPDYRASHAWLAATYLRLGRLDEARAEVLEVLRIDPDFTIEGTAKPILSFKHPGDADHYFDALRDAGLPER